MNYDHIRGIDQSKKPMIKNMHGLIVSSRDTKDRTIPVFGGDLREGEVGTHRRIGTRNR